MKRSIKITAAAVSAALLMQSAATAADYTKEEVAYITLDSAGRPQQTVIVNSFKMNKNTSVTDYGVYKNIKNLTSDQKPSVSDGKIVWNNIDADTFYYQGEKDGGELPWNFSISYTLDGKPISVELPLQVICEVVETEPVIKGQTVSSSYKPAVLDNGVRTTVPPFVGTGDKIVVATSDASYVERAK